MNWAIIRWVAVAMLPLIFLWTPLAPNPNACLRTIALSLHAHVEYDCDFAGIIQGALELPKWPHAFDAWRSPGLVLWTAALAPALTWVIGPVVNALHLSDQAAALGAPTSINPAVYLSGILFNAVILLTAFWLATRLVRRDAWLPLCAAIATCDLSQGWFWVFHPTYVNLLVGLGAVYCFARRPPVVLFGLLASIYPGIGVWLGGSYLGRQRWWLLALALAPTILITAGPVAIGWEPKPATPTTSDQFIWLFSDHPDLWRHAVNYGRMVLHSFLRWPFLLILLLLPMGPYNRGDRVLEGCIASLCVTLAAIFLVGDYGPRMFVGLDVVAFVAIARAHMGMEMSPGAIGGTYLWLVVIAQIGCAFLGPAVSLT